MSHEAITTLFDHLWQDYIKITPSAHKVHQLLAQFDSDAHITNDHIALRTLSLPGIGVMDLAQHFIALGYVKGDEYDFSNKKLNAMHFEHADTTYPKVFISELKVAELSDQAQTLLRDIAAQIPTDAPRTSDFLYSGTHWQVSYSQYQALLAESEYAAWFAAWGYRANHFTVSVNHLVQFTELHQVNTLLKDHGFVLNTSGGEIKGGKDVSLAQSATMADRMPVAFSDQVQDIPSCFYEFAQRFAMPTGQLYQGFVAASADKIFESTHSKASSK
jgi:hypothetical protein